MPITKKLTVASQPLPLQPARRQRRCVCWAQVFTCNTRGDSLRRRMSLWKPRNFWPQARTRLVAPTLPDGRSFFRPMWKFFVHPKADVEYGIPRAELINEGTGQAYPVKVLSLISVSSPSTRWRGHDHVLIEGSP
jgi:hypothetical protein